MAPDLSMATFAAGELVADFSALECFLRAVQMRVVAFDRDSRDTGTIVARIVASQIPRLVCPLRDTALVPRSFEECQFQLGQGYLAPAGQAALSLLEEKVIVQSERSKKPMFDNQLEIGGVILAWPQQRLRKLQFIRSEIQASPDQLGMRSHVVSFVFESTQA